MNGFSTATFMSVLAILLAIAATVLAFIFIVPSKKRERLNPFLRLLHDICNFRFLIIEKILQALYIFSTTLCIAYGITSLFSFSWYEYWGETYFSWGGGPGILVLLLGPIVVRLIYEGLMMTLILIKNVIQINNKMKDETGKGDNPFGSMPNMREIANNARANRPARPNNAQQAAPANGFGAPNAQPTAPANGFGAPNAQPTAPANGFGAPNAQQAAPNVNANPNPNNGFGAAPNANQNFGAPNNGFNNPGNGSF